MRVPIATAQISMKSGRGRATRSQSIVRVLRMNAVTPIANAGSAGSFTLDRKTTETSATAANTNRYNAAADSNVRTLSPGFSRPMTPRWKVPEATLLPTTYRHAPAVSSHASVAETLRQNSRNMARIGTEQDE